MKAARPFVLQYLAILAIALTNLGFGLTIFGFAWTIVGCSPATVHIVSADSAAFQQLLNIEMAAESRRPAHLMKRYVRGDLAGKVAILDDDKLPEPYTQNEGEAVWPANYHLSYAALRLIREFYAAAHPTHKDLENGDLVEIVDKAGGNVYVLNDFDRDRQPDIADVESRFVFDIVPPGQAQRVAGKKKVDWNLLLINQAMLGVPTFTLGTGYAGEVGVRFAEGAPPWKLSWQTIEPGLSEYKWQVLSAAEGSEEAYGKAYLDNRWHDPTPNEMMHFARALHEVVERLVQAREALGQPRADTTMPILPGKTEADYLRSVVWWSEHDDKVARLLPVMREPPAPTLPPPAHVRRGARYMGQTVEGYTTTGRPGKQAYNFHMGNSAHKVIGEHYRFMHPFDEVLTNSVSVKSIVEAAEGDPALLLPDEKLLRPDITNLRNGHVFEIKASGPDNLVAGQTEVMRYLTAINRAVDPTDPFYLGRGFEGELGVKFADGFKTWELQWSTTAPGVIQYKWYKLGVKKEDEAKAEAYGKAQAEGRWVDLTELKRLNAVYQEAYTKRQWVELTDEDMQPYAEQLEQAVDMMVANRERIRATQNFVNVPMDIVGIVASSVLTAELSRLMTGLTKPVPRIPPASVPVTPSPAPAPPAPLRLVPPPATVPGPRMTPVPKTLPRKAAKLELRRVDI